MINPEQIENLTSPELSGRLRVLIESFCALAHSEGYEIKPYRSIDEFVLFESMPSQRQIEIYNNFLRYYDVCLSTVKEGHSLRDSVTLTWNMVKKLELRPSSDLFDKLTQDDVIEIYDANFVQVFRNMAFFEICSYTITELLTYEFWKLYKRDQSITDRIIQKIGLMLSGKTRGTIPLDVEDHVAEEIFSASKKKYLIEQKVISPLTSSQNTIPAFVGTFRVKKPVPSFS